MKSLEVESRLAMPGTGRMRRWKMTVNGYEIIWGRVEKNVLKLTVLMAAQLCEHKNYLTVHFK